MPCKGCAKRARRMLERDGYAYDEVAKEWTAPTGEKIEDAYVEEHHSKLAAKLLYEKLRRYV